MGFAGVWVWGFGKDFELGLPPRFPHEGCIEAW